MNSTPDSLDGVGLAGLVLDEPLGSGSGTTTWSASTPSGQKVAVSALPAVGEDRGRVRARRLRTLGTVTHPGLTRVVDMPGSDPRLFVSELIVGPSLLALRTARQRLRAPEVLGLAHDLASALARLHESGLVHGDVSPSNILLRESTDGAVAVLVDLMGESAWEAGTRGFTAPEVLTEPAASSAADVWSLASVCMWAVRLNEREQLRRLLGNALSDDPDQRPDAMTLAGQLADVGSEPIRLPSPSVLAAATLRQQIYQDVTAVRPTRRARPRHRRRTPVPALFVTLAVVALTVAAGLTWYRQVQATPRSQPVANLTPMSTAELVQRVEELVAWRDSAIADGNALALANLTVPLSQAAQADRALIAELRTGQTEFLGLATQVQQVEVLGMDGGEVVVQAVLTQSSHQRTVSGQVVTVPAQPGRCVQLALQRHQDRWLVATTELCAG